MPQSKEYNFKEYHTVDSEGNDITKGVYRTLLIPISSSEISNNLIAYNEKVQQPQPVIRHLNDLAEKIQDKLKIKINIETQSSLETLFKQWGEEMPLDIRGFVRNGQIYINSSNCTEEDLFHEYTHIILGVLKAKNYDNYENLIEIVANSNKAKNIKKNLKNLYPNLAEQDLNEEVFADLFSKYLAGQDFGVFLNGQLADARKAVDLNMGSIFGSEKITQDFYSAKLNNIFRQFGYDLGKLMEDGNGLEISSGIMYNRASTWIESQIKKYKDSKGELGIFEKC